MYEVANFRERVILSLATDLGLRVSDFLEIKKEDLPDLTQEPPISFDVMTEKEDVIAKGFLSSETVELLRKYIETLPEDNPYLFPSSQKQPKPFSRTQMGNLLTDLARKAGFKVNNGKSLTFHCFRKMFLSASIDSGVGLTAGKILCGKTVDSSDATYLTVVKLREKFSQLKHFLTINQKPQIEPEKLESLKNAVNQLQEDLTTQKTISETVSGENKKIKNELTELKKQVSKLQNLFEDAIEVFQGTPKYEQSARIEEESYRIAEKKLGKKIPRLETGEYELDEKTGKYVKVRDLEKRTKKTVEK
jgi:hypothetical protein